MRQTGRLVKWDDARGFGFIRPADGKPELFVHAKAVQQSYTRLRVGDQVTFSVGPGRGGKVAAHDVDIAGANPRPRSVNLRGAEIRQQPGMSARAVFATILMGLVFANVALGHLPVCVLALYGLGGLLSAGFYRADKRAAEAQHWRTPEDVLHAVDLGFGVIGSLLAQQIFRHKTIKPRFVRITRAVTAAHGLFLGYALLAPYAISISHQWL